MTLGVLLSGQGAQSEDMLELVYGHAEAEAILRLAEPYLGTSVWNLITQDPATLHINAIAQPLICASQLALWTLLEPHLPPTRVFAGYSVGELSAYGCAGALQPAALLALAHARAQAMDESCHEPTRMTAVDGLPRALLVRLARQASVCIAIIQSESRFVVAGPSSRMTAFERAAAAGGAHLTQLCVKVASHTPLMAAAAARLRQHLQCSPLEAPRSRFLAGIDGQPVMSRDHAIDTLSKQVATTIDWAACLEGLREAGCTALLELGPGAHLGQMARRRFPDLPVRSACEFRSIEGIVGWVRRTTSERMTPPI